MLPSIISLYINFRLSISFLLCFPKAVFHFRWWFILKGQLFPSSNQAIHIVLQVPYVNLDCLYQVQFYRGLKLSPPIKCFCSSDVDDFLLHSKQNQSCNVELFERINYIHKFRIELWAMMLLDSYIRSTLLRAKCYVPVLTVNLNHNTNFVGELQISSWHI